MLFRVDISDLFWNVVLVQLLYVSFVRADVVEPCFVVASKRVVLTSVKRDDSQRAVFRSNSETFELAVKGCEGRWVRVAIDTHANKIAIRVVTTHVVALVDLLDEVREICVKYLALGVYKGQSE